MVYNRRVASSSPIIGNLVVFDHFGGEKCKNFGASGGFAPVPHQTPALDPLGGGGGGAYSGPRPHLDKAMTYGHRIDRVNTFFIFILAGSYDFCRLVTAGF